MTVQEWNCFSFYRTYPNFPTPATHLRVIKKHCVNQTTSIDQTQNWDAEASVSFYLLQSAALLSFRKTALTTPHQGPGTRATQGRGPLHPQGHSTDPPSHASPPLKKAAPGNHPHFLSLPAPHLIFQEISSLHHPTGPRIQPFLSTSTRLVHTPPPLAQTPHQLLASALTLHPIQRDSHEPKTTLQLHLFSLSIICKSPIQHTLKLDARFLRKEFWA